MRPSVIVVVGIGPKDLAKMCLTQDHDVVKALSSDRADEPFDVSVIGYVSRGALTSC
jgi:hypothetical protein